MRSILATSAIATLFAFVVYQPVQAQAVATITLPEPGGAKQLYPGCNPVALTFPNGTTSQAVANAVSPAGSIEAIWGYDGAEQRFEAYSPTAPQASDLLSVDFLDAVWICVAGVPPAAPTPPALPVVPTLVPAPPPVPTGAPSAAATYAGTHSGGGTIRFTVSPDGRYVELFAAEGFCGDQNNGLWVPMIRITGGAFYWEERFYDRFRIISGTIQPSGEAFGNISYHDMYGCHRDGLSWTAHAQ
jgi:hypothetical protein